MAASAPTCKTTPGATAAQHGDPGAYAPPPRPNSPAAGHATTEPASPPALSTTDTDSNPASTYATYRNNDRTSHNKTA